MANPDPGPWSPRRAVELIVAATWIVAVLAAWGFLRLVLLQGATRVETAEMEDRMRQATAAVEAHVRDFEHTSWTLATDPTLTMWLDSGALSEPPAVLGTVGQRDSVLVLDAVGRVRYRHDQPALSDVALSTLPAGPGLRAVADGVALTQSTPIHGGRLVYARYLPKAALASIGRPLGIELTMEGTLVASVVPVGSSALNTHTLLASAVVPVDDGARALALHASAPRTLYAANTATFRLLLVVFATAAGAAGLAAMRFVPRLMLRESDRRYSEFVEKSGEAILLVQPDTLLILLANAAACELLGRRRDELARLALPEVLPMSPAAVIGLRGLYGQSRMHLGEVPFATDGRTRQLDVAASQMVLQEHETLSVVVRDVTARHAESERNRHLAWHDPLTGLPNRNLFQQRLAEALTTARLRGEVLGVAFVDVDQFKEVNDDLGHDAADRLLVDVANRLREGVRGGDVVARQGGDEFLVLFPNLGCRADATGLAERVLALFRAPFYVDNRELNLTASVGIAAFPEDGDVAADLVKHADMAMFQAKEAGRDGWQLYDAELRARGAKLVETRTRLSHALERRELFLHYQPQVDLRTGELVGVEALIRWRSEGRMVPPLEFIPVAEQTGLITPIGTWVILEACRQAKAWQDEGLPPVRVAVNLSARQFLQGAVIGAVEAALAETGLDPRWLEVEITESLAMRNPEVARRVLEDLRARGVTVALDDFGTGYSSLAYLRQFPIDRLKIDRSFLAEAHANPEQHSLVAAIITLAHALHLEVVAEGIETRVQLDLLHADGCDIGQGYGLSHPVTGEAVARVLAEGSDLRSRLAVVRVA